MAAEFWQFLAVVVTFAVAAMLWLCVVYLPGRTLERWEDRREEPAATLRPPDKTRI